MSRTKAVLQILLALILFLVAVATLVNMALITMRTEDTDTISVVNTIIGQTVLIVCLVALGRIQLKKGLARYRDIDNSSAPREVAAGTQRIPGTSPDFRHGPILTMLVVKDHRDFQLRYSRCVATIGKFDGVHQGHQAILGQLRGKAAQLELPALVILIEPHPEEFFAPTPEQCPARLNTLDEKLALLEAMDIDFVYLLKFDAALSQLSAADYIRDILVDGLGIAAFIVGNDFRYGYQRRGDFQLLQEAGGKFGFEVIETATCVVEGHRVSSTYVRQQLEAANFPLVERLLGRPYSISGEVVEGRKLGADLGFPTCNVNLHRQRVPLHGVYACEVDVDGRSYPAAVNIGYRPTVTDLGEALLEAHLLDFSGDLYGRTLEVIFRGKVRGEEKFDSLEALIRQIARDVEQVRAFFAAET